MVTLREIVSGADSDTKPLEDLNDQERVALTAERINGQRKFKIGLVGIGVLDKKRAIEEVRKQSSAGKTLVNIEQRVIRMVLEQARKKARGTR